MRTEEITVYEIKPGDRILHYGMVLLVDQALAQTNHPVDDGGAVMATRALITNWDRVGGFVGNLAPVDVDGNHRWTIQSNGRARWTRILSD
ncbi:hypothetical protein SEA_SLIMJIMMY_153 [Mycobacterium phage SlimJimmy]|uniref:Uncharacterized protein n=2 Tax=Bongovirus bongo TaxID=1983750 RepID=A0A385D3A9_9CAUD|nr:hypothetical protein SEA_IPHANE7_153 [Mycobacterium phage IPhane7]QGJ93277.1 hypothetical protein SEA_TYDAWG_149 [Mycobacterium phage TyDawg]WMI33314.1 hypothetical protein SEA_SLIMJIMMY_153 [Mycobacterium phage SlimJimmy]WNM75346.1 hypothetical protein SEA_AUSPICE_156 [Mycobacterium phage Auspice]